MRALLDVNVLIALLDTTHQHHVLAWNWFNRQISMGWASCPITQNGYVRVVSQPNYPNASSTYDAVQRLRSATNTAHHLFWPDSVSLLDTELIDDTRLHGPKQLTDHYLLALAVQNHGRMVTFDRGVALSAVRGARPEHLLRL